MNSTFDQKAGGECVSNFQDEMDISDLPSTNHSLLDKESPPREYVTLRSRSKDIESDLRNDFKSFQDTILRTMEGWFNKQEAHSAKILDDFNEVKKSILFMSEKYDGLVKVIDQTSKRVSVLENKSTEFDSQTKRISELEAKIDLFDQHARHCNAEIGNMPEKKGENLISLLETMGNLVKQPILKQDIVSIHRVPHMDTNNIHPKNIVVKFVSQFLRDNFIAAFRMKKGVTSDQLGISGTPCRIYVNENLTLKRKVLFREARKAAIAHGFKFVWVKHGTILIRENETSPIFAVRNNIDLGKIAK